MRPITRLRRRGRGEPATRTLSTWGVPAAALAALASAFVVHTEAPKASAHARPAVAFAAAIRPAPALAPQDLPTPFHHGCMIGVKGTVTHGCVYGDTRGKDTVVLFGDSHALMNFPALQVVARVHDWRLDVWTKRECTPAGTTIESDHGGPYTQCNRWRDAMLRHLEREAGPTTVVLTGESSAIALGARGQELHGAANARALQKGYEATLRRILRAGDRPVVVEDAPEAPYDVAKCVAADIGDPAACNFPEPHRPDREFEVHAAKQLGVKVIDLDPAICPGGICRAVIDGTIVYRDDAHLTADFSRTLAPRFERALKGVVGR